MGAFLERTNAVEAETAASVGSAVRGMSSSVSVSPPNGWTGCDLTPWGLSTITPVIIVCSRLLLVLLVQLDIRLTPQSTPAANRS